ncbi:MAG TPA: hypothetical protein VFK27_06260, partial [Bacillales bacterium]|nr:hypothetical protein [Bacillales bacterium]
VLLGSYIPFSQDRAVAAYVSYDVNPSFSAAVNGDMQVVSVKTWNQDAAGLFENWDSYKLMDLKDFSREVVAKISDRGYLDSASQMLIATSVVLKDKKRRDKFRDSLRQAIENIRADTLSAQPKLGLILKNAEPGTLKRANENGLSLGKYLLYLDAEKNGKPLSIHSIKQLSVSDIEQKLMKSDPVIIKSESKKTEPRASKPDQENSAEKKTDKSESIGNSDARSEQKDSKLVNASHSNGADHSKSDQKTAVSRTRQSHKHSVERKASEPRKRSNPSSDHHQKANHRHGNRSKDHSRPKHKEHQRHHKHQHHHKHHKGNSHHELQKKLRDRYEKIRSAHPNLQKKLEF